jgi:hypothetical protein
MALVVGLGGVTAVYSLGVARGSARTRLAATVGNVVEPAVPLRD